MIGTYPIALPIHGGQKRNSAIFNEYKKIFKKVKYFSISFSNPIYLKHKTKDLILYHLNNPNLTKILHDSSYLGDLVCGLSIFENEYIRKKLTKYILKFKPDIIQLEQVFPYFGLKQLLEKLNLNVKIIYSSQNIEHSRNFEILINTGMELEKAKFYENLILEKERELCRDAELCIAVSKEDASQLNTWKSKKCLVANNGIQERKVSRILLTLKKINLKKLNIKKFALFVASDNPPNLNGLENNLGWGMGFLNQNYSVVIAGGIGDSIQNYIKNNLFELNVCTFENRVQILGNLSEKKLAVLLNLSEVILLPVSYGGGTNLKTAEALLSNKKIVATQYAFRGFEEYKNISGIYFADTKKDFIQSLLKALNDPPLLRKKEEMQKVKGVLWKHCLENLKKEVCKL